MHLHVTAPIKHAGITVCITCAVVIRRCHSVVVRSRSICECYGRVVARYIAIEHSAATTELLTALAVNLAMRWRAADD